MWLSQCGGQSAPRTTSRPRVKGGGGGSSPGDTTSTETFACSTECIGNGLRRRWGGGGKSGDTVKAREGEGREIRVDRKGAERGAKVKAREGR